MKLSDDGGEFVRTFVLSHYSPKAISADGVKGLGHIDKGRVQVSALFLTFLLEISIVPRSFRKPN